MALTRKDRPALGLFGLGRRYGRTDVVDDVTLSIAAGSFTSILGPSGCGKSTLLRMVAGLTMPTDGRIEIDGEDVTRLAPQRRPTNTVFQSHGLFPHMSVRENIAFGLTLRDIPKDEIRSRTDEAMALVRMDAFGDRAVDRLSGGQQQRVALARALVMRPKILLLDEPLSALDLKLRQAMQEELRRIHAGTGGTFVFVTHDQSEAFTLADNLIVMNRGRVEQCGPPGEVYARPVNSFVANFVGDANMLEGYRRDGRVALAAGPGFASPGPDGPVTLVLRPERVRICADEGCGHGDGRLSTSGCLDEVVDLGPSLIGRVRLKDESVIHLSESTDRASWPRQAGARVRLCWPAQAMVEVDS